MAYCSQFAMRILLKECQRDGERLSAFSAHFFSAVTFWEVAWCKMPRQIWILGKTNSSSGRFQDFSSSPELESLQISYGDHGQIKSIWKGKSPAYFWDTFAAKSSQQEGGRLSAIRHTCSLQRRLCEFVCGKIPLPLCMFPNLFIGTSRTFLVRPSLNSFRFPLHHGQFEVNCSGHLRNQGSHQKGGRFSAYPPHLLPAETFWSWPLQDASLMADFWPKRVRLTRVERVAGHQTAMKNRSSWSLTRPNLKVLSVPLRVMAYCSQFAMRILLKECQRDGERLSAFSAHFFSAVTFWEVAWCKMPRQIWILGKTNSSSGRFQDFSSSPELESLQISYGDHGQIKSIVRDTFAIKAAIKKVEDFQPTRHISF